MTLNGVMTADERYRCSSWASYYISGPFTAMCRARPYRLFSSQWQLSVMLQWWSQVPSGPCHYYAASLNPVLIVVIMQGCGH